VIAHDEFLVGCHGQVGVLVAPQFINWRGAPLANSYPAPKFVNLQRISLDVPNNAVEERGAFLAHGVENGQHGFVLAICQPSGGANAYTFCEQFDDLRDLFMFRSQPVQRLRFRKGFTASDTAITLDDAVFVFKSAKFLGLTGAAMAFQLAFLGKES
jgi:hypothetical protein